MIHLSYKIALTESSTRICLDGMMILLTTQGFVQVPHFLLMLSIYACIIPVSSGSGTPLAVVETRASSVIKYGV
jgi:hypothetical protein